MELEVGEDGSFRFFAVVDGTETLAIALLLQAAVLEVVDGFIVSFVKWLGVTMLWQEFEPWVLLR